jgi:uncharacterized membrane protein (UPF0127 family)
MPCLAKPAIASALLFIVGCSKSESSSRSLSAVADANVAKVTDPTEERYAMPPLPHTRVILKDAYAGAHAVDAEVAASDEATTRGLMWRTQLADGKGMLFIFQDERVRSFWMRNTLIPLDMIFISADGTIVGIVRQAVPRTLTSRSVGVSSKYVLEVPGGWSDRTGIQAGSRVEIETQALKNR